MFREHSTLILVHLGYKKNFATSRAIVCWSLAKPSMVQGFIKEAKAVKWTLQHGSMATGCSSVAIFKSGESFLQGLIHSVL